jgi:hypothetical protein
MSDVACVFGRGGKKKRQRRAVKAPRGAPSYWPLTIAEFRDKIMSRRHRLLVIDKYLKARPGVADYMAKIRTFAVNM